jgi:phosphohistidine swiveling domain-containing protein
VKASTVSAPWMFKMKKVRLSQRNRLILGIHTCLLLGSDVQLALAAITANQIYDSKTNKYDTKHSNKVLVAFSTDKYDAKHNNKVLVAFNTDKYDAKHNNKVLVAFSSDKYDAKHNNKVLVAFSTDKYDAKHNNKVLVVFSTVTFANISIEKEPL